MSLLEEIAGMANAFGSLSSSPSSSYSSTSTTQQKQPDPAAVSHAKFLVLQSAVNSLVLRLKVLDIAQLEKEQGEDGTVPLRLQIGELKRLVEAYDGRDLFDEKLYGQGGITYTNQYHPISYTTTTTGNTGEI